jgi:ABC-type transport system involved in cytochrome bd biosynthesis fused ATPase/permease subunit
LVDGEAFNNTSLHRLRQETAWVDPAVHLWNRSLFDNLHYGLDGQPSLPLGMAIEQAELIGVLQKLENGLQTPLGEGGGLVSGGEGQRVRLARGMLRPNVRLAILDEPFRGLDREQRRTLLARTRQLWQDATLICITHDVGETLGFDRVLVIENGSVVDDGNPQELSRRSDSRYHALLQAENAVREELWADEKWRKIWLGTKQSEVGFVPANNYLVNN